MTSFVQLYSIFDAASKGDTNAAALIAKHQTLLEVCDAESGLTVLMAAATRGDVTLFKYLLSFRASSKPRTKSPQPLLLCAAMGNDLEILKILIEQEKLDPNEKSKHGDTALMIACVKGSLEIVRFLLSVGAKQNSQNNNGMTALICAVANANDTCVELLLNESPPNAPDLTLKNNKKKNALDLCENSKCKTLLQTHIAKLEKEARQNASELQRSDHSNAKKQTQEKKTAAATTKAQKKKVTNKPKQTQEKSTNALEHTVTQSTVETEPEAPKQPVTDVEQGWTKQTPNTHASVRSETNETLASPSLPSKQEEPNTSDVEPNDTQETTTTQSVSELRDEKLSDFVRAQHPIASDLDLTYRNLLGMDLEDLSVSQLTAIQEIHFTQLQRVTEAMIQLARKQERFKQEEQTQRDKDVAEFWDKLRSKMK